MTTEREKGRRCRRRDERGAALVEFALVFPIFMMVVLGMFSGGTAYDQKSAMSSASREGARYASTLPIDTFGGATIPLQLQSWLHKVADYVEDASEKSLGVGVEGWEICVAYVYAPTTGDQTTHETHALDKSAKTNGYNENLTGDCPFADDVPADDIPRVQVITRRAGKIDALLFTQSITLSTQTITRFEALP